MNLLKNVTAIITITLVAVAVIPLLDRRQAVQVLTHKFISPPPVFAGSEVLVQWTIVDLRSGCGGTVYPVWIDSAGTRHQAKIAYVPVHEVRDDKAQTFAAYRTVPYGMVPGDAIYTVAVERWCNPLQRLLWPMPERLPEVKFTVVARP